jgi:hypothetical protein
MPESFGRRTNHVLHKTESHKLHQSFFVPEDDGHDVRVGMPVKLSPVDDFLVQPLGVGDHQKLAIGVAIHDTDMAAAAAGSLPHNSMKTTYGDTKVTVAMRAYVIIMALAASAAAPIIPGPVKYVGYQEDPDINFPQKGFNLFENCLPGDNDMIGWALEHIDISHPGQVALIH